MKRRIEIAIMVTVLAACGAADEGERWQQASPALVDLGVDSTRVMEQTSARQEVELGNGEHVRIGDVVVTSAEDEHRVRVSLHGHTFAQTVWSDVGTMTVSLDERSETLRLDGTAPSAAAVALLADGQRYVAIANALGAAERGLTVPAEPLAPLAPGPVPVAPAPSPPPAPPQLVCSTFLVSTFGWAWFWEAEPAKMACRRATEAAHVACGISTGLPCCNLPASCSACINFGTGLYCYTAGYLQTKL